MEHPNFMYALIQLPKMECPLLPSSALPNPNTPLCTETILLAEIQI